MGEGTGSYGSGLAFYLRERGERVIEIDRPRRSRRGAKSDALDVIRAGREALSENKLAEPRGRGRREAIRVLLTSREGAVKARTQAICQLQALVVSAPENLRGQLRRLSGEGLRRRCSGMRVQAEASVEAQAQASTPPDCSPRPATQV